MRILPTFRERWIKRMRRFWSSPADWKAIFVQAGTCDYCGLTHNTSYFRSKARCACNACYLEHIFDGDD